MTCVLANEKAVSLNLHRYIEAARAKQAVKAAVAAVEAAGDELLPTGFTAKAAAAAALAAAEESLEKEEADAVAAKEQLDDDNGYAGASARITRAFIEAGNVGGAGGTDAGSSFLPMVRVCRKVGRWVWDPDLAALATAAAAAAAAVGMCKLHSVDPWL
jgi:hypothetical protein